MSVNKKKLAIAVAIAVVLYLLLRPKSREVLDPSNSQALSDEFDKLNPTLAPSGDA